MRDYIFLFIFYVAGVFAGFFGIANHVNEEYLVVYPEMHICSMETGMPCIETELGFIANEKEE